MDKQILDQLNRIYATVDALSNEESQDRTLVLQMSQAMLNDLIESGQIEPIANYIRKYNDIFDSAEDADEFAAMI